MGSRELKRVDTVALSGSECRAVRHQRGRHLLEPQESDRAADGDRNDAARGEHLNDSAGQVFVFFILTVAAAEAAIGLAILVVLFRNLNTINVDDLDSLKG